MTGAASAALAATPLGASDVATPAGHAIAFPSGLPGFESCRAFVLKAPADAGPLQCLESVDGAPARFLAIDPRLVLSGYRCALSDADRHALGSRDDEGLLWLALVAVDVDGTIAVNLRAPVVIDPRTMRGRQVVPHACVYPLRHVLIEAG